MLVHYDASSVWVTFGNQSWYLGITGGGLWDLGTKTQENVSVLLLFESVQIFYENFFVNCF